LGLLRTIFFFFFFFYDVDIFKFYNEPSEKNSETGLLTYMLYY
jgi:hypothetical protein